MSAEAGGAARERRAVPLAVLLYGVLGPPVAWSMHFGVLYFVVAAVCGAGRSDVLLPIGVVTLVAAGASAGAGVVARGRWEGARSEAESVKLFLAMGMLGAAFFTGLILLEALPPLFLPPCPPMDR